MTPEDLIAEATTRLALSNVSSLGGGGQKTVLSCTLAGAPAVAKIVPIPTGPGWADVVIRAQREVELLNSIDSPNVVKVLTDAVEVGERPEAICWAEERLSGGDLFTGAGRLWDEDEVWDLLRDIARGLSACHELEVVHRDLSPGNVRHTDEGRFVLMDPGYARHLSKTTVTGLMQPGTVGFMSPEHVPPSRPLYASDIFVLGVLAFGALTGKLPIEPSADINEYYARLHSQRCPDIALARPDISAELADLINQCLDKQPARRFLDGAELLDEIVSFRGAGGTS